MPGGHLVWRHQIENTGVRWQQSLDSAEEETEHQQVRRDPSPFSETASRRCEKQQCLTTYVPMRVFIALPRAFFMHPACSFCAYNLSTSLSMSCHECHLSHTP